MRHIRLGVGAAALVLGVLSLTFTLDSVHEDARAAFAALDLIVGWSFVGSGLVAWGRRPDNRVGPLMVGVGIVWLFGAFHAANESALYTLGIATSGLALAIFVHLILAFPEGRLESRAAKAVTLVAYADAVLAQLVVLLVFEPRATRFACDGCPENALLAARNDGVAEAIIIGQNAIAVGIALAVVVVLVRRWRDATAPARRILAPVLWTGAVTAVLGVLLYASILAVEGLVIPLRIALYTALATVPLAFLAGLLHTRLARTAVSRLVVELGSSAEPGRLREALARALGDPSLALAYWLPESRSYVDAVGRPVSLPAEGSRQTSTIVERDGERVGALIHDVSLAEQPELVESVGAAAGLALENERLQAELRARLVELEESTGRLGALIEASPLAIVEVDLDARVTTWNRAAEELYGWASEETIGDEISFIPYQKAGEVDELRTRMLRGEQVTGVETARLRKDGSLVDVVLSAGPVTDTAGQIVGYMAVSTDITERKEAQDALRRERDFISTLIDSAPVLVIVFDREGRLLRFNRECEKLTGYSAEEVMGRHFWDFFILPGEAERIRQRLEKVWSGDFPSTNENYWLTRDGGRRLILWSNNALLDQRGEVEFIVSAGLDITDRKRAEEEVRASRARILEAGDAERRRLERNLHDGAQQRLVALSLALRLAESRLRTDPEAAGQILRDAGQELSQALEELRELARGIHPAILTDRGLPAALEALAGRAPAPVELELGLEERLPPPVEAAAYYVVSEALANVAKYAHASAVTVSVGRANGRALVEVADDGIGGADPALGSGLRGLADRVEALDGRLEVESTPGGGTTIRAEIPLGA